MKHEEVNTTRILLILFGVSVGSLFSLVFAFYILYFYRKRKLNKINKHNFNDVEQPSNIFNFLDKEKIAEKTIYDNVMISLNNNAEKGNRDKDCSICVSNLTHSSNNIKTNDKAYDISSISSNDSDNCNIKIHNKYRCLPSQEQMIEYTNKRFNPMCTSSPIHKSVHVYSTNDTFSINKPCSDVDCSSDPDTSRQSCDLDSNIDPCAPGNINQNQCTPNSTLSETKKKRSINSFIIERPNCSFKSKSKTFLNSNNSVLNYISGDIENKDSHSNEPMECNLFDPKYVCGESRAINDSQVFYSQMENIVPACCQRHNRVPTVVRYNFQKLCETFADTGKLSYESLEIESASKILVQKSKAIVIVSNRHYFTVTITSEYNLWFTEKDFLNFAVELRYLTIEDNEDAVMRVCVSLTEPHLSMILKNEPIKLKVDSLVDNSYNSSHLSASPTVPRDTKVDLYIDSDNLWKGRSRHTIKK